MPSNTSKRSAWWRPYRFCALNNEQSVSFCSVGKSEKVCHRADSWLVFESTVLPCGWPNTLLHSDKINTTHEPLLWELTTTPYFSLHAADSDNHSLTFHSMQQIRSPTWAQQIWTLEFNRQHFILRKNQGNILLLTCLPSVYQADTSIKGSPLCKWSSY